ncbi:MAG TPA: trypsin-like peptidase domain-containing protein [Solirubrobacter sp.]|nr:trypsin-like peptidase domain-containing protein [Solirubrobacter sp.]
MGRSAALALTLVAAALGTLALAPRAGAPVGPRTPDRVNLGVVAIEARVGGDPVHSSGTVIDAERGLVLTSARAVWGAKSLKVDTGLGLLYGRIVARAPCDGLALVETQPRVPGLVSLADAATTTTTPGSLVTAYGRRVARPGAGLLTLPARVQRAPLDLDARLVPEAAGGPILDADGRLVGIATPAGGAIPWQAVKERLDELRPGPRRVFAGWRDQYECADRLHRITRAAHPEFRPIDARLTAPVPATRVPGAEVGNR